MDVINQLFSLSVGVEPNKQTLQNFAGTLNTAVAALASQQKNLSQYADTMEGQKWVSNEPSAKPPPQLTQPQIKYIEAAPTPQAAQARKQKVLRQPVVWQISEQQLKLLQWQRKQLLQAQKAELARKKAARANRPPPPKLGPSKSKANSVVSQQTSASSRLPTKPAAPKAPASKPSQPKPQAEQAPKPGGNAKGPAKPPAKAPPKPQTANRK
ncbi:uncharacterized protein KY384_005467 [Bacidia gigantensis]|uniref:uncharacterized protein n=1 Tax=Bacidia gigantensis TaxID=2732470 RepID=UPI001D041548|nr:uncharacterized protein KY384_005467 [Bacidia gigantensis]KAG8529985.1 hypothetical protein KY384_005467 [Bacidia gigantensis]